jgi:phospholipid transport system transporter-binding protein
MTPQPMRLPGALTLAQAGALLAQLEAAVDAASASGRFVMDAGAMNVFDTSALAFVLQGRRLAQARGLGFELQALPDRLRQLAELYGVAELLSAAPSSSSSDHTRSVAT